MSDPVPVMAERATACADRLLAADSVVLASHIDADGLTSGAIAASALERAGIPFETTFEKQLDAEAIDRIAATDHEVALFTDFGSGQLDDILPHHRNSAFDAVVADHHQPATGEEGEDPPEIDHHLNPLLFDIDGASELSGAGATYVLARAMEPDDVDNRDLAALAVVGAVGDMQDTDGGLIGANEGIVAEGVAAGAIEEVTDISLYGRQTRPLPKLLEYASELRIPGISGDEEGSIRFLSDLDVDLKVDGDWRRWVDLSFEERQTVASALMRHAISRGVPPERVNGVTTTTYVLSAEEVGTELRDVSEFSTVLNATARYERADVGLAVCLGYRDEALEEARRLLRTHRRNLSEGLEWVKTEGVEQADNLQWFDAGTHIRETIVGIIAGMALGASGIRRDQPIVAFAQEDSDELKVSARGSGFLVRDGLDLSVVMSEAADAVGGGGGGHDVAAGATIPREQRDAFLDEADRIVGEQLGD
ncbi:DHH family phosphoesterase [Halolamina sp. CBA1230]|uniref:single-stranded-DNA-specific exonuclease RecJ n=1 Tax=Halolamina sp. CBA1230 TaxID=1853690 RepID=UPI0009A1FD7A|nr:DHH family phosphoesterase [Halolamina sp. CBA1230]QKY21289.1 DHH family phosphoesterase [Halolamina sp. CBA1230]